MTQKQIFINRRTGEVVELPVLRPAIYQFNYIQATAEMLAGSGWFVSDTDPGYRGKPTTPKN